MSKFLDKHSKLKAAFTAVKGNKKDNTQDGIATAVGVGVVGIIIVAGGLAALPALTGAAVGVGLYQGGKRAYRAIKAAKNA